eukprot:s723_g23.t1
MSTGEGAVHDDLGGLAEAWDNMKIVRDRLQDFQSITMEKPQPGEAPVAVKGTVAKNHPNLRYNSEILVPLLLKMKDHRDKSPDVNALSAEVKRCFEMSRLNPSSITISDEAWSLRYLYGLAAAAPTMKAKMEPAAAPTAAVPAAPMVKTKVEPQVPPGIPPLQATLIALAVRRQHLAEVNLDS